MPKLIFADFSELDCHKDVETGIVNYKELEMCRYLEHRKRMENKKDLKNKKQQKRKEERF